MHIVCAQGGPEAWEGGGKPVRDMLFIKPHCRQLELTLLGPLGARASELFWQGSGFIRPAPTDCRLLSRA